MRAVAVLPAAFLVVAVVFLAGVAGVAPRLRATAVSRRSLA
jgi:hypothetical protein